MNDSESFQNDEDDDEDYDEDFELAGYNEEEKQRYHELVLELEKKNVPLLK